MIPRYVTQEMQSSDRRLHPIRWQKFTCKKRKTRGVFTVSALGLHVLPEQPAMGQACKLRQHEGMALRRLR